MQKSIQLGGRQEIEALLGVYDTNLRLIRELTGTDIVIRNGKLKIRGSMANVEHASSAIVKALELIRAGKDQLTREEIYKVLGMQDTSHRTPARLRGILRKDFGYEPRSEGQARYLREIDRNDIVFSIGPAGTGKTFLAVAKGIELLRFEKVRRLVLVRPAVEAGERLGFLPGDIKAKVNPYLRPIYDALNHFLEFGQLQRLIENDIVEIAPLAYMRGRNLDDAFIILDEAQNTTHLQMKMFLTRMGQRSKIVVTGDITQIDLPEGIGSGLVEAQSLLKSIQSISFVYLTKEDIVRHHLVEKIVDAYERKR